MGSDHQFRARFLVYGGPGRTRLRRPNDRILGPIVAGLAFVAIWPVMRPLRWVDLLVGAWLFAAPWLLGYGTGPAINSLIVGLLLMVLALLGSKTSKRFGGGWASLLDSDTHNRW